MSKRPPIAVVGVSALFPGLSTPSTFGATSPRVRICSPRFPNRIGG